MEAEAPCSSGNPNENGQYTQHSMDSPVDSNKDINPAGASLTAIEDAYNEEEEEEDEFGDFEEATATTAHTHDYTAPEPSAQACNLGNAAIPLSSDTPLPFTRLKLLCELLTDPSLWAATSSTEAAEGDKTESTSKEMQATSVSNENPINENGGECPYDLLDCFDSAAEEDGKECGKNMLWLLRSYDAYDHEEAPSPSPQLSWLHTRIYAELTTAVGIATQAPRSALPNRLASDDEGASGKGAEKCPTIQDSTSSTHRSIPNKKACSSADHAPTSSSDQKGLGSTTCESHAVEVNSLSVPPADFDWHSAGLSNPLKVISTLHVDESLAPPVAQEPFSVRELEDAIGVTTIKNGQLPQASSTLLERDLQAFGLEGPSLTVSPGSKLQVKAREANPLNGSILAGVSILNHGASKSGIDDLLRRNEDRMANDEENTSTGGKNSMESANSRGAQSRERPYKRAEELSAEGNALLGCLPDLSYMLSDRLLFPSPSADIPPESSVVEKTLCKVGDSLRKVVAQSEEMGD